MVDETAPPDTVDSDKDVVAEAEELIGTATLWRGQILHAAVRVGLIDALDADPAAASDLATDLDLVPERTYRLLRAMAHFGVLEEHEDRRFSLTSVGELFRRDHPRSVRSDLLFNRSEEWVRSMLHLPAILSEGEPSGFEREFDVGFFEYTASSSDFASVYTELMELASREHPERFLDALSGYDYSGIETLCDVGGGRGYFLCHLLASITHLDGVVFDLPHVIDDEGTSWARELEVADRCSYVAGDMFDRVPEADGYVLKWILHNWGDEDCRRLLSTVRESARPDVRLFIVETIVPGSDTDHDVKRLDVTMMTQTGGRERTLEEYWSLLEESGWALRGTWKPDAGAPDVLEAVPV